MRRRNSDLKALGLDLNFARKKVGLTLREVSEKTDTPLSQSSKWFYGDSLISSAHLRILIDLGFPSELAERHHKIHQQIYPPILSDGSLGTEFKRIRRHLDLSVREFFDLTGLDEQIYYQGAYPRPGRFQHICSCLEREEVNTNVLRQIWEQNRFIVREAGKRQAAKTHCPSGHPYSSANTRLTSKGHRRCLECEHSYNRKVAEMRKLGLYK